MKLIETKDGTIIEIFVKPNQSDFKIMVDYDEILVSSTEEPVKGRVNKQITKELAKFFHARVEIISGLTSKQKQLLVKGLKVQEVQQALSGNTP
ncbi:MAG TPA: DUF167 family protein [Candidatus Sulfotelmatobacter sp.]|nr:DUF167 family protein [Candidatus Sulfotelmatobacter sp.]